MLRFACDLAESGRNEKLRAVMPVQGQHCPFPFKLPIILILGTNAQAARQVEVTAGQEDNVGSLPATQSQTPTVCYMLESHTFFGLVSRSEAFWIL